MSKLDYSIKRDKSAYNSGRMLHPTPLAPLAIAMQKQLSHGRVHLLLGTTLVGGGQAGGGLRIRAQFEESTISLHSGHYCSRYTRCDVT